MRLRSLVLVTGLAGACSFSAPDGGGTFACSAAAPECPPGTMCIDGRCTVPADAALPPSDFQFRQQLSLDVRDEELTGVPILVLLAPDRFDYSAVQPDGDDIRFVDAGGNPLVHEVESWNPGGPSILWVKLRRLGPGDELIWMYYGSPDAEPPTGASDVWTAYQAVYHLAGGATDSAGTSDGSLTGTESVAGQVGDGRRFDGMDDHILIGPEPPLLRQVDGMTLEAWIRPGQPPADVDQVVVAVSAHGPDVSRAQIKLDTTRSVKVVFRSDDAGEPSAPFVFDSPLEQGAWTWVAAIADLPAGTVRVALDGGATSGVTTTTAFQGTTANTSPDQALIGMDELETEFMAGVLDEVRIAGQAMSDLWVEVQYASMTGFLVTFEEPEAL